MNEEYLAQPKSSRPNFDEFQRPVQIETHHYQTCSILWAVLSLTKATGSWVRSVGAEES